MNATTNTMASFPEKLKQNTAVPHTELEDLTLSKAIISPDVSAKNYLLYLDLMHDVIYNVESTVYPKLNSVIPDINERKKLAYIQQDFTALGYEKSNIKKNVLKLEDNFTIGFAMGVMYVIEGSSLGGRVIYKNIQKNLGYDNESGAAYFSGYGDKTGSHWKNFMAALSEYEKEHNNADEIIAGASHAFKAITKHFTENSAK